MSDDKLFFDTTQPHLIAAGHQAAVYINGRYAWPLADQKRMRKIFCVSVFGEREWAKHARCIDIESGAATPQDAVGFVEERRKLGFNDATCYVNRSNWQQVAALIREAGLEPPLWWVATLDGTTDIPGAWAVQYAGGMNSRWDTSIILGVNNLHRP